MHWLVENTLITALAAGSLLVAHRWLKPRPALAHVLWLLVLLKLLCPPALRLSLPFEAPRFWQDAVAPGPHPPLSTRSTTRADAPSGARPQRKPRAESADGGEALPVLAPLREARSEVPAATPPTPLLPILTTASRWGVGEWLTVLWMAGSLGVLGCWMVGMWRLRRIRRRAVLPAAWLQGEVVAMARRLGVRAPRLLVSTRVGSAFVYGITRPVLMWPSRGTDARDLARVRSVLAHELAHIRRRDHWTAWIEVVATAALWWHPILWLARSQMRLQAELACDAWAVWSAPEARHSYAGALIDAISQESQAVTAVPVLAARPGARRAFETRLNMILNHDVPCRLSAWTLAPVAALSLTVLSGFSFAQEKGAEKSAEKESTSVRAEMLRAVNQQLCTRLGAQYQVKSLDDLDDVVDRYVRDQMGEQGGDGRSKAKIIRRRKSDRDEDATAEVLRVLRTKKNKKNGTGTSDEDFDGRAKRVRIHSDVDGEIRKILGDLGGLRIEIDGERVHDAPGKNLKVLNLSKMLGGLLGDEDVRVEVRIEGGDGMAGGLKGLEELKNLKGLKGLKILKGLQGMDVDIDVDVEELEDLQGLEKLLELDDLKELKGLKKIRILRDKGQLLKKTSEGDDVRIEVLKNGKLHELKGNVFKVRGDDADDVHVEVLKNGKLHELKGHVLKVRGDGEGNVFEVDGDRRRRVIRSKVRRVGEDGKTENIRIRVRRDGETLDGDIEHTSGDRRVRVKHHGDLKGLHQAIQKALKDADIDSETEVREITSAIEQALRSAGIGSGDRPKKAPARKKSSEKKLRKIAVREERLRR